MSINKVTLSGNLTRDPELRQTAGGMSVLGFGIAVNDRVKDKSGNWTDYANFIDCTVFGARADGLSRVLSKGSKIALDGKLRWSQWERDGHKHSKIEVIVDNVDFISNKNAVKNTDANQYAQEQFKPQQPATVTSEMADNIQVANEDIPFN